jgi:hypothetical protein
VGFYAVTFDLATRTFLDDARLTKTPGEVWGLEVRSLPSTSGELDANRVLLCTDSYGGMRIYGVAQIPTNIDTTLPTGPGGG